LFGFAASGKAAFVATSGAAFSAAMAFAAARAGSGWIAGGLVVASLNPAVGLAGLRRRKRDIFEMAHVTYAIVEHDGGWAYKAEDVFSETFATRQQAHAAAERAAREQRIPGESEPIEYEDGRGQWHEETAKGGDRPETDVKD
jgi:hypothetical protein